MLQHEPTPAEQASSPAENRVTPEELAKALAAIESRKEQSAREVEGTIPIGEAVQQLGFDATPEELWAEVRAQRITQARAKTRRPRSKKRRVGLFGLGALAVLWTGWYAFLPQAQEATPPPAVTYTPSPSSPTTVVKTLGEIPDNHTFYCDTATARTLLTQGAPSAPQTLVMEGQPQTGGQTQASWTFTKHHGTLYLHGYTAPRSEAAMREGHVPIYNEAVDGTGAGGLNNDQRITLPVGSFKIDPFDGNGPFTQITVSDVRLDQHSKDNW